MKKLILLTLQLVSYVSSYSLYGSGLLSEKSTKIFVSPMSAMTSDIQPNDKNRYTITQSLEDSDPFIKQGMHLLAAGEIEKAIIIFERAIEENGSPLAYLYRGALETENNGTRLRYLYTAFLAAQEGSLPPELYKSHRAYLTKAGKISVLEWRIKPVYSKKS